MFQNKNDNDNFVEIMRTLTYGTEMNKMFLTDRFFMSDMSVHRVWLRLSDYGQKDGTFVDMYDESLGRGF